MESKLFGKVVVAFLAGVVLALGGAILYSRQTGVTSAIESPRSAAASVQAASIPDSPTAAVVPNETAEAHREAPPLPSQAQIESVPARKRTPAPLREKQAPPPGEVARLQPRPAVSELPGSGQFPSTVPPQIAPSPAQGTPTNTPPASPAESFPPPKTAPAQSPAVPQEPHVVTLPAGTTLTVRLGETLTSDRNTNGDTFRATLDAPVVANGFIIAERQSSVVGHVLQANRAGRVKGLANLVLAVSEINTTDGQRVPVETDSYEKWGNSSVKGDTAKVAGAAALGAIIGAIAGGGKGAAIGAGAGGAAGTGVALGTRGGAASVPSESILTFRLARPIMITEKFN